MMEDQKVVNDNGRKRTQISINGGGGGGMGGLLVLGGALAVTGLIAVTSFAAKKNKAKKGGGLQKPESESEEKSDHSDSKNEDETAEVLSFQNSSSNDKTSCCTTYETSKMLLSSQPLIMEEKLDLKANVEKGILSYFAQEIAISDDAPPGSATSSNENGGGIEDCSSYNPCLGKQEMDKSETETCLNDIEIAEAENEDPTSKTEEETEDDMNEDPTSKTEEETEDDMNEDEDKDGDEEDMESDDVYENDEENSSEETVRSSLDSKEEPIWPADLIEQKQPPLKEPLLNFQSPPEDIEEAAEETAHTENSANINDCKISDSAGGDRTATQVITLMERVVLFVVQKNQLSQFNPLKLTVWIIPMLLLTLLVILVLVTHRPTSSSPVTA